MADEKPAISIRAYRWSEPFRDDYHYLEEKTTVIPSVCQVDVGYRLSDTVRADEFLPRRNRSIGTVLFSLNDKRLAMMEIPERGRLVIEAY